MKRRDPPYDRFEKGVMPPLTVEAVMADGYSREDAEAAVAHHAIATVWLNSLYQVQRTPAVTGPGWPAMWWLSIKRRDRKPIHDWRHLQRIKNDLVGPEHEAVELYPAESRVNDEANQYHLWVLMYPEARFPFGHNVRRVSGPEEAAKLGAVQRPFEEDQ